MSYWESTTMGGIYQTYGLAFFLLGVVSTMLPRQNKTFHFTRHLVFLALFGILHGMAEFIEIQRLNNPVEWLVWLSRLLLLVSYLPLFEFGRRTWNGISSSVWLPASWTYSAVGFIVAMLMLWAAAPLAGLTAGSRWFIGAPAAMLTSLALLATQHSLKRTYLTSRSVFWLHIQRRRSSATAFLPFSCPRGICTPASMAANAGRFPRVVWLSRPVIARCMRWNGDCGIYISAAPGR
jgi:hypothetical protein